MTATYETNTGKEKQLEGILATVESIDKNVEEILDQLTDRFFDMRYGGCYADRYLEQDGHE